MKPGTRSLTRTTAAWLAGLAFALTYLLSTGTGASWQTAVLRGGVASGVAWFVGRPLLHPLFDAILTAIADADADAEQESDA